MAGPWLLECSEPTSACEAAFAAAVLSRSRGARRFDWVAFLCSAPSTTLLPALGSRCLPTCAHPPPPVSRPGHSSLSQSTPASLPFSVHRCLRFPLNNPLSPCRRRRGRRNDGVALGGHGRRRRRVRRRRRWALPGGRRWQAGASQAAGSSSSGQLRRQMPARVSGVCAVCCWLFPLHRPCACVRCAQFVCGL
jgi:hypothetical protein